MVLGGVNVVVFSSVSKSGGETPTGATLGAVPVMTSVAAVGSITMVLVLPVYDAHNLTSKDGKVDLE